MAKSEQAAKLERFNHWLLVNGIELRGCEVKYCDSNRGFGLFSTADVSDGVLLVVPLDLSITPMSVLQDPILGQECRAMYEEGGVDDRFLMVLFLTLEHLRKKSSWKPYLDVLPTKFGTPLWFSDDELLELKGTTLLRATEMQKKNLLSLYDQKVKNLVKKLLVLDGDTESEVCFEDFLWANSIFWTRALNIPFPRSYIFPQKQNEQESSSSSVSAEVSTSYVAAVDGDVEKQVPGVTAASIHGDTVWVEGLVPGIDFCNHDLKPVATWEVDGTGMATGVPCSMYLLSAGQSFLKNEMEISISYGKKGNEELLYLYGFVIDNNPDDYLMVHYPSEALQSLPCSESKLQLLEAQKAGLRHLLPRSLLGHGFFSANSTLEESSDKIASVQLHTYSWCGQRKTPSYLNKLVFPEDLLTTLRTIAIQEDEIYQVASLLQELVGSDGERQPTESEVRATIWQVCGDSGALQLLVDLLNVKLMELEEGSGTEENDTQLLEKGCNNSIPNEKNPSCEKNTFTKHETMSKNGRASIVYRRGQKQLTRLFLQEAEHVFQLALNEGH